MVEYCYNFEIAFSKVQDFLRLKFTLTVAFTFFCIIVASSFAF